MDIIDNINKTLKEDLEENIKKGDKLSIAAYCFSIYAYQTLKKQLESISELRFIFTSPAFLSEKSPKEKREFFIPRLERERSLYGTDFEVKLRNELTQKAIARECAEWLRKKAVFRSNKSDGHIDKFIDIQKKNEGITYTLPNGFTTSDLGCERGNNLTANSIKFSHVESQKYINDFNALWDNKNILQDVTEQVINDISTGYKENSPEFIYVVALYHIFHEFLDEVNEDILPNENVGFKKTVIWNKLYDFQKEAALAIINKLEQYNGCILADSVGLGKTFTALAVIKYYEKRNKMVLVLCPKKLGANWITYKSNYKNNPLLADRFNYHVLYHSDLSRDRGMSGDIDLSLINWENYDLVVIDESHNFRNGGEVYGEEQRENRYLRLLNKVIKLGVPTKVLMLSATPVNNGFKDLRHQLELAYEGNPEQINTKLGLKKSITTIFTNAQKTFNQWSKLDTAQRTTDALLGSLEMEFFKVLDSVTIARSRKHIEKYYNIDEIGKFPNRLPPISLYPKLTNLPEAVNYSEIYECLSKLNLAIYSPMAFVHDTKIGKYQTDNEGDTLRIKGLEKGIIRLMTVNLLKRLESCVDSFRLTLKRIIAHIDNTISVINNFQQGKNSNIDVTEIDESDFDVNDENNDFLNYGKKRKLDLNDLDYLTWKNQLESDSENLKLLYLMVKDITPEYDTKLQELIKVIRNKINNPINDNNKKILIFSAFSDTTNYLYEQIANLVKSEFGLETAMITGTTDGKTTLKLQRTDMNTILTLFSPMSKDKDILFPNIKENIDILIATDCISEGQNLQDCDFCINYDIHWNPVRIIQRFGRIDRIGSKNASIQLVNFWVNENLDEYLHLKGRVETRMKAGILAATGDDNPLDENEKGDLEYRKIQLERLQKEVVDLEEMQSGVSIMDLGLNEFRLDLLEYIKHHNLEKVPFGLHAVTKYNSDTPMGTIFILRNRNDKINPNSQNTLHPFYMVYVRNSSDVYIDHLQPKKLLDTFRTLCKGKTTPDMERCSWFNKETEDGKNMKMTSTLLHFAVKSIVDINEGNVMNSFLNGGQMSFVSPTIEGLNDFDLVCFLVVK